MDKKQLLELKDTIDSAKEEVTKLTGKKAYLMSQLKDQYKCNSIPKAEEKIKKMDKELDELEVEIEEKVKELEEKYDFD